MQFAREAEPNSCLEGPPEGRPVAPKSDVETTEKAS